MVEALPGLHGMPEAGPADPLPTLYSGAAASNEGGGGPAASPESSGGAGSQDSASMSCRRPDEVFCWGRPSLSSELRARPRTLASRDRYTDVTMGDSGTPGRSSAGGRADP